MYRAKSLSSESTASPDFLYMRDLNAIGRIGIGNRGGVTRLRFSIKELQPPRC
jgi:hypothetical protein